MNISVYIRAFSIFVLFFVPCGFARRSLASSKQSAAEVAAHAYWLQLSNLSGVGQLQKNRADLWVLLILPIGICDT